MLMLLGLTGPPLVAERHTPERPVKVHISFGQKSIEHGFLVSWTPEGFEFFANGIMSKFAWSEIRSFVIIPDELPTFYKASVAADILLVKTDTIRRWIKKGKLDGYQRATRWYVTRQSVQHLLEKRNGPVE